MLQSERLLELVKGSKIVVAPGVFSPVVARIAEQIGYEAAYFSGASFSNLLSLPDLGVTTLTEVYDAVAKITDCVSIPLIVDVDTGFGEVVNVQRTVRHMIRAGAAAIQIEDQVMPKKCGHLSGKQLVSTDEMVKKVIAAKKESGSRLLVVARTDARAVEGIEGAVERARVYQEAGADIIFPEALESIDEFIYFRKKVSAPLLANMTEFGKTPYISAVEFEKIGYNIVIFPVTALRAALKAVKEVLTELKNVGTQKDFISRLMTREEVYRITDYYSYESLDSIVQEEAKRFLTSSKEEK